RFLAYLKETKEHILSNKEFVELDKLDGIYLTSFSALYSSLLRLRVLFIMDSLLTHNSFSNKKFKMRVTTQGISYQEFDAFYDVYRRIRDNKSTSTIKIKIHSIEKLILLLDHEVKRIEEKL
ncbi:MAG: hypothetical protein AABX98_07175, partial [Nanoarchaeota archaeon]